MSETLLHKLDMIAGSENLYRPIRDLCAEAARRIRELEAHLAFLPDAQDSKDHVVVTVENEDGTVRRVKVRKSGEAEYLGEE